MSHVRQGRGTWVTASFVAVLAAAVALVAAGTGGGATNSPITIGVMSTCKGPFAPFYEATLLGAAIAGIEHGGTPVSKKPSDFVKGITIGGHPVRFVRGCSDGAPEVALAEARPLVGQGTVHIPIRTLPGS